MDLPTKTRRPLRRAAIIAGGVLVGLTVLFGVLLALVDSDAVIARIKDKALPMLSEKLGREVTLEAATARIFPSPHVTLTGLRILGPPGEPPLMETAQADVDLKWWPIIRSFGKDVQVDVVTLLQPEVNLVHRADGTWNYEGLGGPDTEPQEPQASDREYTLGRLDIAGGIVRVVDRSTPKAEATLALEQMDLTLTNLGIGEALGMKGVAAFASDAQNLEVDLSTSALRSGVLPDVNGTMKLQGAQLSRLEGFMPAKLSAMIQGGHLDGTLKVATKDAKYALDGDARANAMRMRGQPANGGFRIRTTLDPKALDAAVIHFDQIVLKGPGVDLAGTASATLAPRRVRFDLHGPLLDINDVLAALPESPEKAKDAPPDRSALLPANVRAKMDAVEVRGTLKLDRMVNGKLALEKLDAEAILKNGVFTFERAQAQFFGGQIDVAGTTADLVPEVPTWTLAAKLDGVNLASAMSTISGSAPLEGQMNATLGARGEGSDWDQIRKAVTGTGALALNDGALTTTDLGAKVGAVIAAGLQQAGKAGASNAVAKATGKTELRELAASFRIKDGWLSLNQPLSFTSPLGQGRLGGRIGLDMALDLTGEVIVSQDFLASTVGRTGFTPKGPMTVPLTLDGTLLKPSVGGLDPGAIATQLAKGAAQGAADKVKEEVKDEVKSRATDKAGELLDRLGGGR